MRSGTLLLLMLAGSASSAQAQQTLSATSSEPRAFGYYVGDRIKREVTIHVPAGLALDESSLPRAGARGQALELQEVMRSIESERGGTRERLQLGYQVFKSPPLTQTLETAPIVLHFTGQPRAQDLRIEAWPVTVSPLVPVDPPTREGLGELRPDQPPQPLDARTVDRRLLVEAVVALLLLAYLAQVYLLLPWWSRRRRPFGLAWQQLRKLPADGSDGRRGTFQRLHQALNETAGEVLFAQGLERFLAAHPRFQGLRADLVEFFRRSRHEFFDGDAPLATGDPRWLLEFCRKCRDAERGAA